MRNIVRSFLSVGLLVTFLTQASVVAVAAVCTATVTGTTWSVPPGTLTWNGATSSFTYTSVYTINFSCSAGDTSGCHVCAKTVVFISTGYETGPWQYDSQDFSATADTAVSCGTTNSTNVTETTTGMRPHSIYKFAHGVSTGNCDDDSTYQGVGAIDIIDTGAPGM